MYIRMRLVARMNLMIMMIMMIMITYDQLTIAKMFHPF